MSDSYHRFGDEEGRVWRPVIVRTGESWHQGPPPAVACTLVLRPDDAERPVIEIPVSREMWHAKRFTDAELRSQLTFARQFGLSEG